MHQFTSRGARPREIQASVAQSAVRSWQMSAGAGLLGLRQLSQRVHYRGLQVELRGLRPNFLAGCQPEVDLTSMENCSMHYIENVRCTNPDTALVEELRKSFVSGHATTASFNMVSSCSTSSCDCRCPRHGWPSICSRPWHWPGSSSLLLPVSVTTTIIPLTSCGAASKAQSSRVSRCTKSVRGLLDALSSAVTTSCQQLR
ncbi:uncharacterized protein LOC112557926 [Pomacea canaliculata]|uniref:uncharacterized protein LOC112557926 n=1 Tax=Pomacea canaliculata TaxID=400727 RepID=UPI000D732953|nr:uncharacterized protein LOC112557926 [Pomacea canaliculata]XP_025083870.1 uncharacterized protein LOC112557926 [Pomacea canaliculata]